jgi:hypothetical protein
MPSGSTDTDQKTNALSNCTLLRNKSIKCSYVAVAVVVVVVVVVREGCDAKKGTAHSVFAYKLTNSIFAYKRTKYICRWTTVNVLACQTYHC